MQPNELSSEPGANSTWAVKGLKGMLVILLTIAVCEWLFPNRLLRDPGLFYWLADMFVAYWAGWQWGLLGAAAMCAWIPIGAHLPSSPFHYTPRNEARVIGSAIIFCLTSVTVGLVQTRVRKADAIARDASRRAEQATRALRSSEELRQLVMDSSMDAVIAIGEDGTIELWNPNAEALFGWTRDEAVGKTLAERTLPPRSRAALDAELNALSDSRQSGDASVRIEWIAATKDNREFAVEMSVATHKTARGTVFVAFVRDISARKRAEQEIHALNAHLERRVAERTAELEAVNRELEAFSYSASHDLRGPLRTIDGFSQILIDDYGDQLEEQAKDNLLRIRAASRRMAVLMDDLINLARVGQSEMRLDRVDLSALAHSVATDLQHSEPNRNVEFSIQPHVIARADSRLLGLVLQNLIENAWKFTARNEGGACIEFGSEERNGRPVYFVRDNGAGFDMAHSGRLFGTFQRLHGTHEFSGSGIGLATVRRIVERHRGEIWAEGEVGKGATFTFALESAKSEDSESAQAS